MNFSLKYSQDKDKTLENGWSKIKVIVKEKPRLTSVFDFDDVFVVLRVLDLDLGRGKGTGDGHALLAWHYYQF